MVQTDQGIEVIRQGIQSISQQQNPSLAVFENMRDRITSTITDDMIVVNSKEDVGFVADIQNLIKWLRTKIETHRKETVEPLRKQVDSENLIHKNVDAPLALLYDRIETNKKSWQKAEDERVWREKRAAEEAARLELERKQEAERRAREAQETAEREALEAQRRAEEALRAEEDAKKAGDIAAANEAARLAEEAQQAANQAEYEAQKAAEKADTLAPLIPVAVVEQVEERQTTIRTETGTQSSVTRYTFRLARPQAQDPTQTTIPLRFFSLNDKEYRGDATIGAFVRSKAWTVDKELSSSEFTVNELGPDVIVIKDITNRARVNK